MESRVRTIQQVIRESMYVVDERAVADAIMLRAMARVMIAEPSFRSELRGPVGRSFRRDRDARSFRLCGSSPLQRVSH